MPRRGRTALLASVAFMAVLAPGQSTGAPAPLRVGVASTDLTWHVGQNRLGDVTSKVPEPIVAGW